MRELSAVASTIQDDCFEKIFQKLNVAKSELNKIKMEQGSWNHIFVQPIGDTLDVLDKKRNALRRETPGMERALHKVHCDDATKESVSSADSLNIFTCVSEMRDKVLNNQTQHKRAT